MAPVLWLTGLSGAGKSTLAQELERKLRDRGYRVQILDGDTIRAALSPELGYTREDRIKNVKRLSFIAGLLAQHDAFVLVAAIAPYRISRTDLRSEHPLFVEVYVNAPVEVCARRDPKGLYARAAQGAIQNFTGVSDDYEPPLKPDVECFTDVETVDQSSAKILNFLDAKRLGRTTGALFATS